MSHEPLFTDAKLCTMTGSAGMVDSLTDVICVLMSVYSSVWLVATTEKLYMSPGSKFVHVTVRVNLDKEQHKKKFEA